MRTVGQILKEAREAKFYSVEEVEKAIKIRKELLVALEEDNFAKLPPATFLQGFIKNYARFLGLDSQKLLAIFRREFSEKKNKTYVMDAFANPITQRRFRLTPGRVLGLVVSLLIISFFAYLWFQYRNLVGMPDLQVSSPPDQYTAENATILVDGRTDPEVKVTVNGQEIRVGTDGSFKEEITLSAQVSKVLVEATSKLGRKSQIERTVYLNNSLRE